VPLAIEQHKENNVSFAEMIKGVAIPDAPGRDMDSQPRVWWHNGVRAAKTGGSFYTKQAEFVSGLDAPWKQDERFEGEVGYSTEALKIAVLAYRQQPFFQLEKQPGEKFARKQWLLQYEKGAKFYTEVLCFIEGYSDVAVWASDGLTGKAVGGKGGIMQSYEAGLLAQAEQIAGQPMPRWSFWLPIATKRTADGKVAYEDTGFGSFVTPPALHLPADAMDTLFVGPELLERGARLMKQYAKWQTTRRLPENTVEAEYTVSSAPALPPARNVPQPVTEADLEY
jgi:hypothetical protein